MSWQDWRTSIITTLNASKGEGSARSNFNETLPMVSAIDMTAILALISPALIHATQSYNSHGDDVPMSNIVDDDGQLLSIFGGSCTATQYVAGIGQPGQAWIRSVVISAGDKSADAQGEQAASNDAPPDGGGWLAGIEPAIDKVIAEQASAVELAYFTPAYRVGHEQELSFLRQAMADWQRCLDIVTTALQSGFSAAQPATVAGFFTALGSLCSDLDTIQENPPSSLTDDIAGGLAAATDASAKAGGQLVAAVANTAGTALGAAGKGFFSQASIATLIATGAIVYLKFVR